MLNDAPRITPDELRTRLDQGDIVPVDVRLGSWDRSDVKAKDAIRIEASALSDELDRIPEGADVVTYCTCPNENTSARAAALLNERGYHAAALAGGFEAYQDAGLATEPK